MRWRRSEKAARSSFVDGASSGRKDALKSGSFLTGGQAWKIIPSVISKGVADQAGFQNCHINEEFDGTNLVKHDIILKF
jgi:hypothetical protein